MMMSKATTANLRRMCAGSLLSWVFLAPAAHAQVAPRGQEGKGTKQRVANPLNDLLDQARRDIDKQDFPSAVAALQKFIAEKDDFAYAHFQLGYAYTGLGKAKEAQSEYQRAIELDPKMPEAALNLGILLLAEEPAGAVVPLRRAVELLPTQSRPRTLLGLAYEKAGDQQNAERAYEGALALDPADAETTLHLAQLYLRQERAPEAEAKFSQVLSLDPQSRAALVGLGASLEAQKKPQAADAYRNYLRVEPRDRAVRERLVRLLVVNEKFDEALAEMEKQDDGGAPAVETLKLRADILIGNKRWREAIAVLKQAVALAPNDAPLRGGLGRTYLQQRDFANAQSELKTAIKLDAKNLTYWKDLASTTYLSGEYATTLELLDRVAQQEPPTAGELFVRALCYDKLRQTKAALDAYERFLKADENRNPDQVWQAEQRIIVLTKILEKRK